MNEDVPKFSQQQTHGAERLSIVRRPYQIVNPTVLARSAYPLLAGGLQPPGKHVATTQPRRWLSIVISCQYMIQEAFTAVHVCPRLSTPSGHLNTHIIRRLTPKIGLLSTCPRNTPLLSVDVDKTPKIGVIRLYINALACPLGVDKRGHLWTLPSISLTCVRRPKHPRVHTSACVECQPLTGLVRLLPYTPG